MKCPQCSTENRDTAKFCDECGYPLNKPVEADAEQQSFEPTNVEPIVVGGDALEAEELDVFPTEKLERVGDEAEEDSARPDAGELDADAESEEAQVEELLESLASKDEEDYGAFDEELYRPADDGDYFGAFDRELYAPVVDEDYVDEGTDRMVPITDDAVENEPVEQGSVRDLAGFDQVDELNERLLDITDIEVGETFHDGDTMEIPLVQSEDAPQPKAYLASTAKRRMSPGKIAAIIIALLLIGAAIAAFATYQAEVWGGKSIPNVTDMTQADATERLEAQGFTVRATKIKSDDTEGVVKVVDPQVGSRAPEGSEVVIHVTAARYIPDIAGMTDVEAQKKLAEEGFENVTVQKESSDEPEGTVIAVDPTTGTKAKANTPVVITVAEAYTVPDISNMYLNEAQETLAAAGLESQIIYVYTEDGSDGYIIGTDPTAGTKTTKGAMVSILISRSRSNELVQATQMLLVPGSTITLSGIEFIIDSVESVEYVGSDTTTYLIVCRPVIFGIPSTSMQHAGQIVWNSANEVVSLS